MNASFGIALCAALVTTGLGVRVASARLVPAVVIAADGDPIAGGNITSLNAPFTNAAGQVGFTFNLSTVGNGVWFDSGPIWLNRDALPDTLTGAESTMGIGPAGSFIYSPALNGDDCVWGDLGLVEVEGTPAPDFPPPTVTTFHSRPQMIDDGTALWVAGFNGAGGTATQGRVLYRRRPGQMPTAVVRSDDLFDGFPVSRPDGVDFDYHSSGNGNHIVFVVTLETGSTTNDQRVVVDGLVVAAEGAPTGDGDNWQALDTVSINDTGTYLFTGDTDGPTTSDEVIAVDARIRLREGSTVDGVILTGGVVHAASLNNLGQMVHLWGTSAGEHLFFADSSDLMASTLLLETDDEIDVDNDRIADYIVTDFNASSGVGPGLDLAEDGFVYVEVDLIPVVPGVEFEAILRLGTASAAGDQLCRSTVASLVAGWKQALPLPLTPASTLDTGWPMTFRRPGMIADTEAFSVVEPLVVYRLVDASSQPLGNDLRVVKQTGSIAVSY